jgi:hypothetical protein
MLDQEQIEATAAAIAPRSQSVEAMPDRPGADVATEIGRRFLLRYLVDSQLNGIRGGQGIEYYLAGGFPKDAVVDVGVLVAT